MTETIHGEVLPHNDDSDQNEEDVSSENLLNYSQRLRRQLASEITREGMPSDEDNRKMLLHALRDMDRTSVDRLKVDVDQQANDTSRQAQEIVNQLYGLNARGLRAQPGEERDHIPEPAPGDLPEIDAAPGETDVGLSQENVDSFLNRVEGGDEEGS